MAPDYDSAAEVVASPVLLGGNEVLRFFGRVGEYRELVLFNQEQGFGFVSYVEERRLGWSFGILRYVVQ
jgi:hypothetical protein